MLISQGHELLGKQILSSPNQWVWLLLGELRNFFWVHLYCSLCHWQIKIFFIIHVFLPSLLAWRNDQLLIVKIVTFIRYSLEILSKLCCQVWGAKTECTVLSNNTPSHFIWLKPELSASTMSHSLGPSPLCL